MNAVTWGVFKGKEVIQPTVVDHNAFLIWKDEAFLSWVDQWGVIYGQETESYAFLKNIYDSFYLVNVVDNNFVNGNLNKVISDFIEENQDLISSL